MVLALVIIMSLTTWFKPVAGKSEAKCRNSSANDDGATPAENAKNTTKRKADSASKGKEKKFIKLMNQENFDWYCQDTNGIWHCEVCRKFKRNNAYAKGHSAPAKTTNHTRHGQSQDHMNAKMMSDLKGQLLMDVHTAKALDENDEAIISAMKVAFWLGQNELPKDTFTSTLELLDSLGLNLSSKLYKGASVNYTSHQSVTEFQSAISNTMLHQLVANIKASQFYGLTIDESTDRGNQKRLLLYTHYYYNNKLECDFLSNVHITSGTANADAIVSCILEELRVKGLDIKKLIGMGTDGASVMTGKHNGVVKKLKDMNNLLIGVHCSAHRLALAASQAAKHIPDINNYSRTISNIFHYFSGSALRSNKLREIQQLMDLPELKYADIFSVRWLSMQKAVDVVYRTYPALYVALEHEACANTQAKGLFHDVRQYKFIAITHMLMDILPLLSTLSKVFQTECLDFSVIQPMISSTVMQLSQLNEVEGHFMHNLKNYVTETKDEEKVYVRPSHIDVQSNGEDQGVKLHYYEQQKQLLAKDLPMYITKIIENLNDRFQDSGLLAKFHVLCPINIHDAQQEGSVYFAKYGKEEIDKLFEHYSEIFESSAILLLEYNQYKSLVMSLACKRLQECVSVISKKYFNIIPNMAKLLQISVLIPISSVSCERGFSTQNRIVTQYRTKVNVQSLNDLTRISESSSTLSSFNFTAALSNWKKEKKRKIYQN